MDANNSIMIKFIRIIIQELGTIIRHHDKAQIAEIIAAIVCTLFSIPTFLKLGAAPTNIIDAQVKKDKNCQLLPSVIFNQEGKRRLEIVNIIIGKRNLKYSFFCLYI